MPNIFLISVDALRFDHLGCYGYPRNTSPNIDAFAEDSVLYENAFVNGIPTFYSIPSLLTATYPLDRHPHISIDHRSQYLPFLLQQKKFTTATFIAENPWLSRHYGYDTGFDKFEDYFSHREGRFWSLLRDVQHAMENNAFLKDKTGKLVRLFSAYRGSKPMEDAYRLTEDAKTWLQRENKDNKNLFLWIHYMDPHYPWLPKHPYLQKFASSSISRYQLGQIWHKVSSFPNVPSLKDMHQISEEELATIQDLYDAEINYVDHCVGRFLTFLKKEGLYEDSVILFLADHGTEFLDHSGFGHGPHKLYNELIKVPLIIKLPSMTATHVKENVQFLDIVPSLLSFLEGEKAKGRDSFFDKRNEIITTECIYDYNPKTRKNHDNKPVMACMVDKWKLIVNEQLEQQELYNIKNDPEEKTNLIDEKEQVAKELSSLLSKRKKEITRKRITEHIQPKLF